MLYSLLQMMSNFAVLSGNAADTTHYQQVAAQLKEAYNKKYFNYETAQYDNGTVTANLLSLRLGLVPEGYEAKVFQNIVNKTVNESKSHVSVGVMGIQHLMRGLTEYGNPQLAYTIATNETYPSWGYMAKQGATTIWELWNGDTAEMRMNSGNHVMLLGDLVIWFYENLAGIRNDPQSAGFKKILMQPVFIDGLDYVKASYNSVSGKIKSHWERKDGQIEWEITIPANTTATVNLKDVQSVEVAEGKAANVKVDSGNATIDLPSGEYKLVVKM